MAQATATILDSLPQHREAEKAILTALMLEPEMFDQVRSYLQPSDFFAAKHQAIWKSMAELREHNQDFNPIVLWDQITRTGRAEWFNGIADLGNFISGMPFFSRLSSVRSYIEVVLRSSLAREMLKLSNYTQSKIADHQIDEFSLIEDLQTRLKKLQNRRISNEWSSSHESLATAIMELENTAAGVRPDAISTGFPALDSLLINRGLVGGSYFLIAARTSRGKSTLALQMAHSAVSDGHGKCVAYFTIEMTGVELMKRLIAIRVGVPYDDFRQGKFTREQSRYILELEQESKNWKLPIVHRGKLTPSIIHAEAIRIKQEYGRLDAVVIDHIGLLHSDRKLDNRAYELGQVSHDIKSMLVDLDCVGIVPAQINREGGKSSDRIALHHLRDSGDLEQDADLVGIINITEEGQDYNCVAFDLAKQRNGKTGVVEMFFDLSCGRFLPRDEKPKSAAEINWKRGSSLNGLWSN